MRSHPQCLIHAGQSHGSAPQRNIDGVTACRGRKVDSGQRRSCVTQAAPNGNQLVRDATATEAETLLRLEHIANRRLHLVDGCSWPERDSGGSSTEQHRIRVTQRNRSSSGLPRPSELWVGIDAGQHVNQLALVNQPVERTDQVRMITPYYKPTVRPQQ